MNRTSKFTRLSESLREELNQRLRNGEPANNILLWLNQLPEVLALVEEHYGGNLISPQNLSDWNLGGYREWLSRQEMRESSKDFATEAPHLTAAAGGSLLNPLTTAVLARYGALLSKMPLDAEIPKHIQSHLDNVLRIHQALIQERHNDLVAQKTAILAAEQERKNQKADAKEEADDEYEAEEEEEEEVEDEADDEVEADDAEAGEAAAAAAATPAEVGKFGTFKVTVPKVKPPVAWWDEHPEDILDEAALRALHARTADDIRREIAQAKAAAADSGRAAIKPGH